MRKIIQLIVSEKEDVLTALCSDGSIWFLNPFQTPRKWQELEIAIPQPTIED